MPRPESVVPSAILSDHDANGVAWQVARARAREGHLGVVSLVSVGQRLLESLQHGDIGGTMRWALDQCPLAEIAGEIKARYFVPSEQSNSSDSPAPLPLPAEPQRSSLLLIGAFAEVFLAKHGHAGRIGIAWPDQTDLDDLAMLSGAMLARVDCVLVPPDAAPFVNQAIDLIAADDFAAWTGSMAGTAILPAVMVVDSAFHAVIDLSDRIPLPRTSHRFGYENVPQ